MSKEKLEAVKAQFQNLLEKATEMEMEKEEFEIVLKALEGMKDDRKCFRQISGILVEQNVAEAKPYLKSHLEGISSILDSLLQEKAKKESELKAIAESLNVASN